MAEDSMSGRTWTSKTGYQQEKLVLKYIKCNQKWQQINGPVTSRSLNSMGNWSKVYTTEEPAQSVFIASLKWT